MAVHQRGWLDTKERIRAVFNKADALVTSLKTRNANVLFGRDEVEGYAASKWALLITYGAYKLHATHMPEMHLKEAVAIGELIAPILPESYFLDRDRANQEIVAIITYYLQHETPLNRGRTRAGFLEAHGNVPADERGEDWNAINGDISDEELINEHGDLYVQYLLLEHGADQNLNSIDLFITLYVSVAKRGNVTADFITKITNRLSDDLQHESKINEETISLVYKYYGGSITADNACGIMDRWLNYIPEAALRVRLTLQQVTNYGLTALVTVGRAIVKYPDFPWGRLNVLTGGELANLNTAAALVNGNQYYGFNKSLGAARSTLYRSLAYVAKELLINLNGEVSLKKYAGWIRAPKSAAVVKAMIDSYKTSYLETVETQDIPAEDAALYEGIRALLVNNQNANMYA